jgi:putative endonuclease
MYYVYCLRSLENGQFYTGLTNNLERRIIEHNSGKNRSTKAYIPYELLFFETVATRIEARNREKYLKSGVGREFIKRKLAQ